MKLFRHILLMTLILGLTAAGPLSAQEDEDVIPEAELPPASSVPQIDNGNTPTPPVIIDESDSSGVSDSDDYDN